MKFIDSNTASNNDVKPSAFTVSINYQYQGGYHIFSSADVKGMLVASRDPAAAIADLCPVIEWLIEKNLGLKTKAAVTAPIQNLHRKSDSISNKIVVLTAA